MRNKANWRKVAYYVMPIIIMVAKIIITSALKSKLLVLILVGISTLEKPKNKNLEVFGNLIKGTILNFVNTVI